MTKIILLAMLFVVGAQACMYVPKLACLELYKVESKLVLKTQGRWIQYGSMKLEGFARNKSYQWY